MKKEMLINVLQAEECRIAIVEDGVLEELYVERTSHETYTGNIYKGRIVNLEPAIQAAFVDFSIGRNGFLHVSDVEPRYYQRHLGEDFELGGRDRGRDPRRVSPGPEAAAYPAAGVPAGRGPRAPRGERGRRDRGERRPAPPTAAGYPPEASFGVGLSEFDYPAPAGYPEVVEDAGSAELPIERAPRPDNRRDRPRRGGPGRDRGRSRDRVREREFEPLAELESTLPREFDIDMDLDLDTDPPPRPTAPVRKEPPFAGFEPETPEQVETPAPRSTRSFAAELFESESVVETRATEQAWPEAIERKPAPTESQAFAPTPSPVPTPAPETPSRPRRAFGAGLEDWDTQGAASSRKPRLTPINLPTPQAVQAQVPVEPKAPAKPDGDEETTTSVTRSIQPAPAPRQPRRSLRSRFGSGLIEENTDKEAPREELPTRAPDIREPLVEAQAEIEAEPIAREQTYDQWAPALEADSDSDTWTEYTPVEPIEEPTSQESAAAEEGPSKGRRRRRSGNDRVRSRSRRSSDEAVEPLAESDAEFAADEAADTNLENLPVPKGREAIRARGGERQSRGARPPVQPLPDVEPRPAGGEPRERSGGRGGRYVPRLERERISSNQGGEFAPGAEFAGEEGDFESLSSDLTGAEVAGEFEGTAEQDPRLGSRGRDARNRRRRRRRRPGDREGVSPLETSGAEPADAFAEDFEPTAADAAESEGWSELDWSAALAKKELTGEASSELDAESSDRPGGPRQRRQRGRFRRNRPMRDMGPAPGEDAGDEMDDDFSVSSGASYTIDPTDIVEPELEEEIRREAEEIAALEIELGIRQPGEIRESPRSGAGAGGRGAAGGRGFYKPPIQDVFQRSDEVLVQVIKESLGTKGPTLSTYISIPGRYLVLMPGLNRVGVSRKIPDEGQRRKLRDLMNQLNPPKGLGFIVRTAGVDRTKRELARDLAYLLRLWKTILRRIKRTKSPAPIYQESDMIIRTIRDIFNSEIDTIWIDEPSAFERAQEFLRNVMPKFVDRLKLYEEKTPLFHKYGIEDEIAKIGQRHVPLPDGGSIVIDQTEALVAIDVNSGNFRVENDAERTAYEMNLRAAKEIARQLRLRDLGGVIVNDFIDMRDERHRRGVERALRDAIRRDRARTKILRMSQFGLIEMTRQRIRPSIKRSIYEDCPNCLSQGVVKSAESMSIDVMRILALAANRQDIRRINISCSHNVANFLNNRKRQDLARLERDGQLTISIKPEENVAAEFLQIDGYGNYNTEIRLFPTAAMLSHRRLPNTTGNAPALPYQRDHGHSHSHSPGRDRDRGRGDRDRDRDHRDRDRNRDRDRDRDRDSGRQHETFF